MATASDELIRKVVSAYSSLAPSMRERMVWRMNLDTFKSISKFTGPPACLLTKIPVEARMFGMLIEEHSSSEILLVMKVA